MTSQLLATILSTPPSFLLVAVLVVSGKLRLSPSQYLLAISIQHLRSIPIFFLYPANHHHLSNIPKATT
jgi:hypothetical protein